MSENSGFMQKLCTWIVKRKNIFIVLFLALFIFSLFSMNWVKVQEDMVYFLDEDTESRQCLDIDAEEFDTFGSMYFMVCHVTEEDTQDIISKLDNISNIAYYTQQIREEEEGTGYTATFYLSFVSYFEDSASMDTYNEVSEIAEQYETNHIYSDLTYSLDAVVNQQMTVVILMVSAVVIVILLFTSRSFAEIPVFVSVFVFAAVINLGTNFLLGTISLVSNAVAVTMQLALSLDYAIIFSNRYWELHETMPTKDAVTNSLKGAAPEILASSLTTIAGLLAMTFMTFGIGMDMGVVLIKAIAISLLTVFLFMPGLIIIFGKAMDKSAHKRLIPQFTFLGKFAYATRFIVPVIFVGLAVGGYILFNNAGYLYDEMKAPVKHPLEETVSYLAITEELNNNQVELLVPEGDFSKEKELMEKLSENPQVKSVSGIANSEAMDGYCLGDDIGFSDIMKLAEVDETTAKGILALTLIEQGNTDVLSDKLDTMQAPLIEVFSCLSSHINDENLEMTDEQKEQITALSFQLERVKRELLGENYSRIVLMLDTEDLDGEDTFALLDELQATAEEYYPTGTHIAGYSVIYRDFAESFEKDKLIISVLSIALVMIILLFTFRSITMPILLTLVIQSSVWINFGLHGYIGNKVYFIGYLIVSAIMMGSNIDYAIVISSRFREMIEEGRNKKDAMIEALRFALPTVITSGGIMVVAGLLIYEFMGTGVVAGFGLYVATGTLITIFLVLFVLPQILLLSEGLVRKTTYKPVTFKNPVRARRSIIAIACVVAIIASTACFGVLGYPKLQKLQSYEKDEETLKDMTVDINRVAKSLESFPYFDLVEQYLTGTIGAEELLSAKEELSDGAAQLAEGQALYDAGKAEYEDYLAQYQSGESELIAGESELNENTALYNEYMAQYEAGKKEYEDGLKQYNEGKAQYDAAMEEYTASKAELSEYDSLYGNNISGYKQYLALKEQYDTAVATGDTETASNLELRVKTLKLYYETSFFGGQSISELLTQYEDYQAQLADAEVQLAEAKAELEAGEKELAAGKAELEAAEKQLADANIQLTDGASQLADGKAQLADAQRQLAEGKSELDAGEKELSDYYAQYEDGKKQIEEAEQMVDEASENYKTNSSSLAELLETKTELTAKLEDLSCIETVKAKSLDTDGITLYNQALEYCENGVKEETSSLVRISVICGAVVLIGLAGVVILMVTKRKIK